MKSMTAGSEDGHRSKMKKYEKSYFDVLGICCSSEVPLIEKLLKPLEGVHEVSVIVPTRTVIVLHDPVIISQLQIVKALNQARLEANVRIKGESNYQKKWPSPFAVACGILLLLSFLKYLYHPFQWLALVAVVVGIAPIILKAIASIRNFRVDINILMLIAVAGSIVLKDYWEAGTIVFLFTIAEWLESRASHKATAVMSSLMNIAPQRAILASNGLEVDASEVMVNTILAVKAGDTIPIDGIVVDGKCEVDEKALTGESFPVTKQLDSAAWAGTINLNGYISIKTTALAEDCVVAKMAKLVEEAQNNKSQTQRFIDKCAIYYTPAVVIISGCIATIPASLKLPNRIEWYHLALVVLVSACPCALILSTPIATFCALSKAATSGLLIKGAEYLETLAKIRVIAFDKTGTITRGEFLVSDFHSSLENINLSKLLYWVSSIESKSSHPMAAALIDYAHTHSIEPKPDKVEEFQNFPGEGIYGKIDGEGIFVGNRKIAIRAGCVTVPNLEGDTSEGKSTGYIFLGSTAAGIFSLSDVCRTGVAEALKELKSMGIKTAMLTGDCQAAANHAQRQLGDSLEIVHAELLPEDKARIIKEFQSDFPTAMVGDGLNDAPALATADIGISMGVSGSALATETGNIILLSNDIRKIPKAIKLARKTRRKIIENVVLSIATKAGIIGLAIAGHPLVWAAVLADVGTCLLVIFNSMLLLRGTQTHGRRKHCSSSRSSHNDKHGCKSHSNGHEHCSSVSNVKCSSTMCAPSSCESNKKCSHSKSKCKTDHFISSELHGNNENGCCESGLTGVSKCSGSKITHSCCEFRAAISATRGDKKCSDDSKKTRGCCKSTPTVQTSCGRKCLDSEIMHADCESSSTVGGFKCLDSHEMITIDIEKPAVSRSFEQKSCSENKQDCYAHTHDHIKEANHSTHGSNCDMITLEFEEHVSSPHGCSVRSEQICCPENDHSDQETPHCHSLHEPKHHDHSRSDQETLHCHILHKPKHCDHGHSDQETPHCYEAKHCYHDHSDQEAPYPHEAKHCDHDHSDQEAPHSHEPKHCALNHSDQETPHCHSLHEPRHHDHSHSDQETPHCHILHEPNHHDHIHSDQETPHCHILHEPNDHDHSHSDQETPHCHILHEPNHHDHSHSDKETPHCHILHEPKLHDHSQSDQETPPCHSLHEPKHHDRIHADQETPHCHILHEPKHCDQETLHCNGHKHSGHNSLTCLEPCQGMASNYKHCHHAPITEEELKNVVMICCKYYSSSDGCENHGTRANGNGCCKSFRKEGCSKRRSAHFALGGLSEIVIE